MSASGYFHINPEVDPIFNLPPFFDLPNILQSPWAPFPGPLASNPELYSCHSAVWFLRLDLSMSLVEDRLGGGREEVSLKTYWTTAPWSERIPVS